MHMVDYISATKYDCKSTPFLGHCKLVKCYYNTGWNVYTLQGCEKMEVWYNESTRQLIIKGSLAYFYNGHNFKFTSEELVKAVNLIDGMLGCVGLWGAEVTKFENGVIVPVSMKPKDIIGKHFARKESKLDYLSNEKYKGKFSLWKSPVEDIKLYDAGANIMMKQGMNRREIIEGAGWNPDGFFLKCEVRYKKPELLNMNRTVRLEKLQNQSFLNMLKGDLMEQYHLLTPAKSLVYPSDKKDFNSMDAVVLAMIEALGLPVDQVKRMVYDLIDHVDCVNKSDKDHRKKKVREAFGKVVECEESKWDLTNILEEALDAED